MVSYLTDKAGNILTDRAGNRLTTRTVTIDPTTTTALVASPASPVMSGTSVTFTATVTSSDGGAVGTVNFLDGATVIASRTLSGNTAVFSTSALSVSTHSITANYLGDGTHNPSTSPAVSYTVTALVVHPLVLGLRIGLHA